MSAENVSISVIRRLPRYYRYLSTLKKNGVVRISSGELAAHMQLTASQIRHDLNCFGGFGQQGYGYNVSQLASEIEKILYLDNHIDTIIIGIGNLGRALSSFLFDSKGISIIGLFDKSNCEIMESNPSLSIMPMTELDSFCKEKKPKLAILCIPGGHAQSVAEHLSGLGIKGFWNFSQTELVLDEKTATVENVHLIDSIMTLSYNVNTMIGGKEE